MNLLFKVGTSGASVDNTCGADIISLKPMLILALNNRDRKFFLFTKQDKRGKL
jgi:hypothetical protein